MNFIKKLTKFLGLLSFAFIIALCLLMGVATVIPKRKEQFSIEVKMEQIQSEDEKTFRLEQFAGQELK